MLTKLVNKSQPSRTKKYSLQNVMNQKELSQTSRHVFFVMLYNCFLNSSIVKIGYKDLMWNTGIESKATVSKCLKELIGKEMISKIERSTYRLWYVSKREAQEAQETLEIETETRVCLKSESSNIEPFENTPNTPYKDSINIISRHGDQDIRENRITENDDNLDVQKTKDHAHQADLTCTNSHQSNAPGLRPENKPSGLPGKRFRFSHNSPFKSLTNDFLKGLLKRFDFDLIQDRITKLEKCYCESQKQIKCPPGLLYNALFKGQDWAYQNRKDTVRAEILRDRELEEKKMEKHWWEEKQHEKKVAIQNQRLKVLEKDPVLKQKCISKVKETHPTLDENSGMFKFLLRNALLEFQSGY